MTEKISCFVPIQLQHDYKQQVLVQPMVNASTDPDVIFAIIQTIVGAQDAQGNYNSKQGFTQDDLFAGVLAIRPETSRQQFDVAFSETKRRGILMRLVPPVINWLLPLPEPTYTLSFQLDSRPNTGQYVIFMLQLIGGYTSPFFVKWFRFYRAPQERNFELFGC